MASRAGSGPEPDEPGSPVVPAAPDVRDRQRARVYDAEALVHRIYDRSAEHPVVEFAGSRLTLPIERRFATLDSVASYVRAVLDLTPVRARWPRSAVPVRVRERSGHRQAHYERSPATIAVPLWQDNLAWALRELVILHELAHHLADGAEPAHGPEFTARLVELVDLVIGAEAAFLLRAVFWDNGVGIAPTAGR